MKRRNLLKTLEKLGCVHLRYGTKHDIYHNPKSGATQPVPRHREINEKVGDAAPASVDELHFPGGLCYYLNGC